MKKLKDSGYKPIPSPYPDHATHLQFSILLLIISIMKCLLCSGEIENDKVIVNEIR